MRALVVVVAMVMVLVAAWVAVHRIDSGWAPARLGPARAYCDTGRGVFLPCTSVEHDGTVA